MKKIILVTLILISILVIGYGVSLSYNKDNTDDEPSIVESMEDKALNVIIDKSGEDKNNYSFNRIDEEGHYVFNKKDDDSIEIVVDIENDSYMVVIKEKIKGA